MGSHRVALVVASSAVALVAVSSCASDPAPSHAVLPGAPARGAVGPLARNKAAARVEAGRLLSRAVLPPDAVRQTYHPKGLSGPALGTPLTTHLIDETGWFRVRGTLQRTRAWFAGHPQPGLRNTGSSSSTDRSSPTSYGFGYDPVRTSSSQWTAANLEIGMVRQGRSATAIRVDGMTQWIDPRPEHDTIRGRTMRLTTTGGCPAADRGVTDVSNADAPDLDHHLLPAAQPTAALRCNYAGLDGPRFRLVEHVTLHAARADVEARRIRRLPLGRSGSGATDCPADDGRVVVLAFAYRGRSDIDIWEHAGGCGYTDNGRIISGGS